eukprot:Ihof_evm2s46 gene=Ihof_evmTU2s46
MARSREFDLVYITNAAAVGDAKALAQLIQQSDYKRTSRARSSNKLGTDKLGRSPLHFAAAYGNTECARLLCEEGDDVNLPDRESGWTSLHRAIYLGHTETAIYLISKGANPYLADKNGLAPLDMITSRVYNPRRWTPPDSRISSYTSKQSHQFRGDIIMHNRGISMGMDHEEKGKNELDNAVISSFYDCPPGKLFTWGSNATYALGHASQGIKIHPRSVAGFWGNEQRIMIQSMVTSAYHSAFITSNGDLYTCGHGQGGRLGLGNSESTVLEPLQVNLQDRKAALVAANNDHTCVITTNGELLTFGQNTHYQLGHPANVVAKGAHCSTPRFVRFFKSEFLLGVAAGQQHTAVFTRSNVYMFGCNNGQLGQGKGEDYLITPKVVAMIGRYGPVCQVVAASKNLTVVMTTEGEVLLLRNYTCQRLTCPTPRLRGLKEIQPYKITVAANNNIAVLTAIGALLISIDSGPLLHVVPLEALANSGRPDSSTHGSPIQPYHFTIVDACIGRHDVMIVTSLGHVYTGELPGNRIGGQKYGGEYQVAFKRINGLQRVVGLAQAPFGLHYGVICDVIPPKIQPEAVQDALRAVGALRHNTDEPKKGKERPLFQIGEDLGRLLSGAREGDGVADIVFVTLGGNRVAAHRYILANRSLLFASLCTPSPSNNNNAPPLLPDIMTVEGGVENMAIKGKGDVIVHLRKVPEKAIREVLTWIYTDTCPFLKSLETYRLDVIQLIISLAESFQAIGLLHAVNATGKWMNGRSRSNNYYRLLDADALHRDKPLKRVYDTNEECGAYLYDATIIVGTKPTRIESKNKEKPPLQTKIHCHKALLISRSAYFQAMVMGKFKEGGSKPLVAHLPPHISYDVGMLMVDYMYTNSVTLKGKGLAELFEIMDVAGEYLLDGLKSQCEIALAQLLEVENITGVYEASIMYDAQFLQKACLCYAAENMDSLLEHSALDQLLELNSDRTTWNSIANVCRAAMASPFVYMPPVHLLDPPSPPKFHAATLVRPPVTSTSTSISKSSINSKPPAVSPISSRNSNFPTAHTTNDSGNALWLDEQSQLQIQSPKKSPQTSLNNSATLPDDFDLFEGNTNKSKRKTKNSRGNSRVSPSTPIIMSAPAPISPTPAPAQSKSPVWGSVSNISSPVSKISPILEGGTNFITNQKSSSIPKGGLGQTSLSEIMEREAKHASSNPSVASRIPEEGSKGISLQITHKKLTQKERKALLMQKLNQETPEPPKNSPIATPPVWGGKGACSPAAPISLKAVQKSEMETPFRFSLSALASTSPTPTTIGLKQPVISE